MCKFCKMIHGQSKESARKNKKQFQPTTLKIRAEKLAKAANMKGTK